MLGTVAYAQLLVAHPDSEQNPRLEVYSKFRPIGDRATIILILRLGHCDTSGYTTVHSYTKPVRRI